MIKTDKKTLEKYLDKSSEKKDVIGDNDGQKYGEKILPALPLSDAPKDKKER